MRKRRVAIAAASVALVLALTGCRTGGSPETDDRAGKTSDGLYERTITLVDGRVVTCVVWSAANQGGVSCDWFGAGADRG